MHKLVLVLLIGLAAPTAYANCGNAPAQPALLQTSQITISQIDTIKLQLDQYFAAMDAHQACLEAQITQLVAPEEDGTEAFFSTPEYLAYQSQFDVLIGVVEQAEQYKVNTIASYNAHLINAVQDPE